MNNGCKPSGFSLGALPAEGANTTPDHSAAAPGNQEQFVADVGPVTGPGCATPAYVFLAKANWTVSDPVHVHISSAPDATNGLATCVDATQGAATVTATFTQETFTETANATITCK